jgi:hypothetical protein
LKAKSWLQRFNKAEDALGKAIEMFSPEDDCYINFGKKHVGKTFGQVAEVDPDYLKWCLGHPTEESMKEFLSWLRQRLIPEMERQHVSEVWSLEFQMNQVFHEITETKEAQAFHIHSTSRISFFMSTAPQLKCVQFQAIEMLNVAVRALDQRLSAMESRFAWGSAP